MNAEAHKRMLEEAKAWEFSPKDPEWERLNREADERFEKNKRLGGAEPRRR
jgi:hypothetical protein